MSLRSLYIFLTFLTVGVLLGGITFIYLDGQKVIRLDQETSQDEIEKSLLVMTFFTKFRSFVQTTEIAHDSIDTEFEKLQILQNEVSNKLAKNEKLDFKSAASFSKDYYDNMKKNINLKQNIMRYEKKNSFEWKQIETFISDEIVKQLKNGQEFLPNFKSTLSKWGESIPLFEKLKNSIDVSYVNQENFLELKELMNFSNWLLTWKIESSEKKTNLTDTLNKLNYRVNSSSMDNKFKDDFLAKSDQYLKNLKKLNKLNSQYSNGIKSLVKTREQANKLLTLKMIPKWQGSLNQKLEKSILSKNERHQSIVQIATIMGVFIVLVMSFLFLNIFPYLNTLEQKAKLVGKGEFLTKIDKKIPKNEIGQVMKAFNEMAMELSKHLEKIKKHEQEKTQLTNSIQRMRRISELGEFSAKMAHELKNPLSILNFCLNDALDASIKGDNTKSTNELKKSLHAMERLKVISGRLGAKSSFTEPECINVKQMIDELVSMYDSLISKEDVSINVAVNSDDILINAPKLELMGAISNLFDNAIEYLKSNKTEKSDIEVAIGEDANDVLIEVSSKGKQIDDPDKLFNSFYSDKKSITRGMGLVIVKDIVESIGGSIEYVNEAGVNKFIIKLPTSRTS